MLFDAFQNRVTESPFPTSAEYLLLRFGRESAAHLATIYDAAAASPRASRTGQRSFSATGLMHQFIRKPDCRLLDQLHRFAYEDLGEEEAEVDIQHQVEQMFGIFVWECITRAPEECTFTDNYHSDTDC